jgi:type IV secretory pathway TrbD component
VWVVGFGGLIMAIAASMLVQRTARGDDMFMTMAGRHGHHALDLEAADLLG